MNAEWGALKQGENHGLVVEFKLTLTAEVVEGALLIVQALDAGLGGLEGEKRRNVRAVLGGGECALVKTSTAQGVARGGNGDARERGIEVEARAKGRVKG